MFTVQQNPQFEGGYPELTLSFRRVNKVLMSPEYISAKNYFRQTMPGFYRPMKGTKREL